MNGRDMFRQSSGKQTNAQTQATQLKKQMVEKAGRRSPTKQQSNDSKAKGNVD